MYVHVQSTWGWHVKCKPVMVDLGVKWTLHAKFVQSHYLFVTKKTPTKFYHPLKTYYLVWHQYLAHKYFYNFRTFVDPSLDSAQRIAILQQKLQDIRKTYANVKAELATVERRRKKLRRREREGKMCFFFFLVVFSCLRNCDLDLMWCATAIHLSPFRPTADLRQGGFGYASHLVLWKRTVSVLELEIKKKTFLKSFGSVVGLDSISNYNISYLCFELLSLISLDTRASYPQTYISYLHFSKTGG